MKICSECNVEKDILSFYKSKENKDGFKNKCKSCLCKYFKSTYVKKERKCWRKFDENYHKEYHKKNPDYNKNYIKNRRNNDSLFKLKGNLRNLIKNAFLRKFTKKSKKSTEILGTTFEEFQIYIQNQFNEQMSWENYGKYWEIDHIKPVALGKDEDEIVQLNHYSNLRPLKIEDNRKKSGKWDIEEVI